MSDIQEQYLDALKEIISIGIGRVSATLEDILEAKTEIRFAVPETTLIESGDVRNLEVSNKIQDELAAVTLHFSGPFSGDVALTLPIRHAKSLVSVITHEPVDQEDFDEILEDTMSEVGNMLLNSMMGTISNVFMEKLQYEVPKYSTCENKELFADFESKTGDELAFLASTSFNIDEHAVEGDICILFGIKSFDQVLKSVDVTDLTRHLHGYRTMCDKALDEVKMRKKIETELREKNSEFEAFSRRVAHDLRNPLCFMKTMANFMINHADDKNKITHYAQMMHSNAERGLNIIDGIYQLSGLDGGKYDFENYTVEELLENSLQNLQLMIEESGAEIIVECKDPIRGVKNLLPQIFQNLISNSIKFVGEGKKPVIKISSKLIENGHVLIRYEDNGPGIPEKHRDKVFSAFERLHGADVEGLGLGLNIVRKIVELHDGKINLGDSADLGGVSFDILLNIRRSERKKVKQHQFMKLVSCEDPSKKMTLVIADESEHGVGGSCHRDIIPDIDEHFWWNDGEQDKELVICWRKLDEENDRYQLGASFVGSK